MTALVLRAAASPARRRGAALPIVLLFAALLAGLAAAAMRSSLGGVRAASAFTEAARADELGRGAGDALAYHLATHDAAARRGGRLALHLPDAAIDIEYRSESARVDVNHAPPALIGALLLAAGAEPEAARDAADRVRRFREQAERRAKSALPVPAVAAPGAPGAAPDAAFASAGPPAVSGSSAPPAPGAGAAPPTPLAIRDPGEIVRAWGLPEALARRVLPSLTVSNGTAQVDPILADKLVLEALLGSAERVDDYLARRADGFVSEASARELLPVPSQAFAGFHDAEAVQAFVRVALAHGFARRYEMVLAPARPQDGTGTDAPPSSAPLVVSWRRLP